MTRGPIRGHQRSSGARIGSRQRSSVALSSVPPERRKREPAHRIRMQRARRSHPPERPDRGGAEQKYHVARGAAHLMREAISMYSVMESTCDVARWSSFFDDQGAQSACNQHVISM